MIFIMIYVSFDMILGAYLIGNMTALIVKGSKTEKFRDKMKDVIKYMNRNKLGRDIRDQIKGHLRLQHESSYTEASILEDIPISIRSKVSTKYYLIHRFLVHLKMKPKCNFYFIICFMQISQTLYKPYIENVNLFKGCSAEFMQQIVSSFCSSNKHIFLW